MVAMDRTLIIVIGIGRYPINHVSFGDLERPWKAARTGWSNFRRISVITLVPIDLEQIRHVDRTFLKEFSELHIEAGRTEARERCVSLFNRSTTFVSAVIRTLHLRSTGWTPGHCIAAQRPSASRSRVPTDSEVTPVWRYRNFINLII